MISTTVYSNSLIHSSASFILLLIPSRYVFHFSYCILPLCLVVIFYNSLKLCNFSASVLSHILGSSLWSLLRIHSWVDCWSPHQLSCISEVLSCSLVQNIFLCHLILSKLLHVFLCIWKVNCVSQTWRSGALQGLSYMSQQHTLLASPRGQRLAGAFPLGGGPGSPGSLVGRTMLRVMSTGGCGFRNSLESLSAYICGHVPALSVGRPEASLPWSLWDIR